MSEQSTEDGSQIRVISFNIHKGLNPLNTDYVLQRIRDALRTHNADILLLQEIVDSHSGFQQRFPGCLKIPQFDYLAEGDWPHRAFGQNAVHRQGSHGNAVLSRYPIHQWDNIDMSRNRFEQRGILHTRLRIAGVADELHFCCVHLNLLDRDRQHQIDLLNKHLNEQVPAHAPLIVAGDFNDWSKRASEKLFRGFNLRESHHHCTGDYARTFPSWRPLLKLDRIYFRNLQVISAAALSGSPWRGLSDHLPLSASFKFPA